MFKLMNISHEDKNTKIQDLTSAALKSNKLLNVLPNPYGRSVSRPLGNQINAIKNSGLSYCRLQLKNKLIFLKKCELGIDLFMLYIRLSMRESVTIGYSDASSIDFWHNHLQRRIDNNIGDLKENIKRQKDLFGISQDIEIISYYRQQINIKLADLDRLIDEGNLITHKIQNIKLQKSFADIKTHNT